MQTEVLQYKGAPLTVRVFERFDYVDISRATPYGGSARFKLQGVTVTAEPYVPGYNGSTKHIVISPGGENLTPILGALGGKWPESRFLGMPTTINPDRTFEPPELPQHLTFARDVLKWSLTPELNDIANTARER